MRIKPDGDVKDKVKDKENKIPIKAVIGAPVPVRLNKGRVEVQMKRMHVPECQHQQSSSKRRSIEEGKQYEQRRYPPALDG